MPPVIPRLAGEGNFRHVYKRGIRLRGKDISISALKVADEKTRVAVVVSRKVSSLATKRNLYKRRLWGCLRDHRHQIPPRHYLVITAQPSIKQLSYQELSEQLKALIDRIVKNHHDRQKYQ